MRCIRRYRLQMDFRFKQPSEHKLQPSIRQRLPRV